MRLILYLCFYYTPCAIPNAGSQRVSDGTVFNLFTFEVSTSKGVSIWEWDSLSWKRWCKGVMYADVQTYCTEGTLHCGLASKSMCVTQRNTSVLHKIIKRPTNQILSVKNWGSSPSFLFWQVLIQWKNRRHTAMWGLIGHHEMQTTRLRAFMRTSEDSGYGESSIDKAPMLHAWGLEWTVALV